MSNRNFYRQGMAMKLGLIVGLFLLLGVVFAAYLATRKDSPLSFTHASAVATPSEQNILRNGGFERPELANTWDTDSGTDGKATITTLKPEVYEGKQGVKLFKGKRTSIKQSLSLPADQTYKVVGYYQTSAQQPVLAIQVGNDKSPETQLQVTTADAASGWKSVTSTFSLPLSTYSALYSSTSNSLPVIFKIKTPGTYSTVIIDSFKLSLAGDLANLVQNAGFENWKSVQNSNLWAWTEHDAVLSQDKQGNSGNAVNILGLKNATNAPYIDQDITSLVVKGADYTVSADVKGSALGTNTGWVSVSQEVPTSLSLSFVKEVNAMELSAATIDPNKPCSESSGPEVILKTCRKFFTATTSWTNVSQMFHIDDRASRVWVNLATYAPSGNRSEVSFDNVSMVYKPVVAPTGKPTLVAPTGGATIKENAPALQWTRMTGLGGNTNIDYYVVEVSDKTDVGNGGGFSNKVFWKNVDQVGLNVPTVSQTVAPALAKDGVYYWHVKAFNKGGLTSGWSDVWNFTVDTKRPDDVKLTLSPKLGASIGNVTVLLNWVASTDPSFAKYVIDVKGFKDVDGKTPPAFTPIEITDRNTTTKSIDLQGLQDGDYTVNLRVVDSSNRGNTNSRNFSLYEDGFKNLKTDKTKPFYWNLDAESKEVVKINGNEKLAISDRNNENRDDNTGVQSNPFSANQFDLKVDFSSFTSDSRNSSQSKLVLYVPQGNKQGYEVGITNTKDGRTFQVGTYSQTVPAFPFTVGVNMDNTGLLSTYLNGTKVNAVFPNLTGKDFGGVGLMTKQAPPGMPDVDASFDNFRLVWVK